MSVATPVGSVVEIVAGMVKLASSETGQQLLAKWFLDAGLTEDKVHAHVVAMKRSPSPKEKAG